MMADPETMITSKIIAVNGTLIICRHGPVCLALEITSLEGLHEVG